MNFLSFSRLLTTACFLCLLAAAAAAQSSGVTYGSYTSIEYDEETNTVTAYSETVPEDYELAGYYQSQVTLTVTNEFGVTVASASGEDNGYGVAPVELNFAGEPGRTYTATGTHRVLVTLYSYDNEYPYRLFYWDSWYYTPFESQGIYFPWYYGFYRPVYEPFQRRTRTVLLGKTYDSVSTQRYEYRGSIQAQGPDIKYRSDRKVPLGDNVFGNGNTVSRAWAQRIPLTAAEGIDYVNAVKSKMTSTQLYNREGAFRDAINFIKRCGDSGGCPPRNYNFPGINGAYVDVVINAGNNLVSSTTAD